MAALTLAIIGAAAAGYQVYQGREQRREGRRAASDERKRQRALEAQVRDRERQEEATRVGAEARRRQRALAFGGSGRASTIRTTPLGLLGGPPQTQNQLLGG